MTTLQSKSIVTSEETCRFSTMVRTNSNLVRDLYQRTKVISDEFKKVYKYALKFFLYSYVYVPYVLYQCL